MSDIDQKVFDQIFRKLRKTALVYLRGSKTKEDNYDPFRKSGFTIENKNPLPVKVLTRTVTPESLVYRQMGITEAGAIQIILHDRDVVLIKNSEKIEIANKEYYVYNEAVGNKFLIFPTEYAKYSKIILFRRYIGNA